MGKQEAKVEAYLIKKIKELGGDCYKIVSPGRNGMPDRICCLPKGVTIWVEVKTEIGVVSKIQVACINRLRELGHRVMILFGKTDVDAFITGLKNCEENKNGL